MSALDKWGMYKTPCTFCGGEVEYWYFDSDCSYNPSSSGIQCKDCKKEYSQKQWDKIEKEYLSG